MTTGQMIFRETGRTTPDGRKLMMVAGILAFDEESMPAPLGEHQYVITGDAGLLMLHSEGIIDRTEDIRGSSLGGTLQQTIWRH